MKSRVNSPIENGNPEDSVERPFRLLTIFDSTESNAEAESASQLVIDELGDDVAIDNHAWDMRLLDSPVLRERAAEHAASADVILLALSAREPSEPLRQWLEQWQKSRTVQGGLLALIPTSDESDRSPLAEFFSEAAITANMDFLCRKQPRF